MKFLFSLIAFGFFGLTATAQEGAVRDTSNVKEFRQLAEQWRIAYNSKNAKTKESMYTKDAEYISPHVAGYVAYSRDRVIANFHNGANSGGYIDTVEVLSVNSSCDMATLVTKYVGIAGGNKVNGRNLLVCRRVNGQWLIVTHMTVVRD